MWSWNLFSMVMLMDLKHYYWQYSNCLPKFKGNCKLIIQFLSSQLWADVCMNFFMIITSLMAVILLIDWLPWSVIHLGDSLSFVCVKFLEKELWTTKFSFHINKNAFEFILLTLDMHFWQVPLKMKLLCKFFKFV